MAIIFTNLRCVHKMLQKSSSAICIQSRNDSHWLKDFKPGRYPKNWAQRISSAYKYRVLPEEYEPFPDEGLYYGDYPDLPAGPDNLGIEAKDDFYPYDYPEHKRNFKEPIHANIDLYNETRWSLPARPRYTNFQCWSSFLGVMGSCLATYYFLEDKKMFRPVMKKQLYMEGVVHYTFEHKEPEPPPPDVKK